MVVTLRLKGFNKLNYKAVLMMGNNDINDVSNTYNLMLSNRFKPILLYYC